MDRAIEIGLLVLDFKYALRDCGIKASFLHQMSGEV